MRILFILLLSLTFVACKTVIDPNAPETRTDEPEKLNHHPISTVSVPIVMSLSGYYDLAEKQVPNDFKGGEHPCEGVSFDYYFKRSPFNLKATNNNIVLDVTGKYWIKMSYCAACSDLVTGTTYCVVPKIPFSCGIDEPMRRMSLQYTTSFDITKNYSLSTKTSLTDLKAIDPCEVTVFQYDATDQLLAEVRKALKDVAKDVDKQLSEISFKKEAQGAWDMLNKPIKVKDFGILHMNPSNVFLSDPKVHNDSLYTTLTLNVAPVFDYSAKNDEKKLPDLTILKQPKSDSFDLHILFNLNYDSLSNVLQHYAGGKEIVVKNKKMVFDSLSIAGADNNELIIKVQFSGTKSGLLYLRGIPTYNAVQEQFELKNISYDLATKSVLLKTADWLFDERIIEEIGKASKQNLHDEFEKLRKSINDAFHYNMNEYNVSGLVNKINVVDLVSRKEEIRMLISATGKVSVNNFGQKH